MCDKMETELNEALPIIDNEEELTESTLEELSNGLEDGEEVNDNDLHEQ